MDVLGPLITGGITAGVSLIGAAYGFGRLTSRVDVLTSRLDVLTKSTEATRHELREEIASARIELVGHIDKMRDDLVTVHERLARLERSTPSV